MALPWSAFTHPLPFGCAVLTTNSGRLSETMGNNEAALGAYNRVLHFNQFSLEALQAIAAVLRAEEKYDQAVEYIDSILKLDHTDGESWSHLGKLQCSHQIWHS